MGIDKSVHQRFASRFGLLVSALGIAVGTGNIWRFPRIAAQSGSDKGAGALIIAWLIFLFIWSIPLIIAEYLIGRKFRKGVVGAFVAGTGKRFAWMGAFVGFVATAISCFYAVIVGWAIYYLFYMLLQPLPSDSTSSLVIWENFQEGNLPFLFHLLTIMIGLLVIWKGITSIERVNKILIPLLIIIIFMAVIRALLLPGSLAGIAYLFRPDWHQLGKPEVWLQALTQNAWDTGAGWGLFLTYAAYMRIEHGTVKNAFITGIGNNTISLLMAIMIFATVFSVLQFNQDFSDTQVLVVMKTSGPASSGLTFIWLPQLFATMKFGKILTVLFFLGLVFAGFTSLVSMLEMATRVLIDRGMKRKPAIIVVVSIIYLLGIPSVISLDFLNNQDFVWGLGLIISGLFIAVLTLKYGSNYLKQGMDQSVSDWGLGKWWDLAIKYFVPVASILLIIWWLSLSFMVLAPEDWYNPLVTYSAMTCLAQWTGIAVLFAICNKWIIGKDYL